MQQASPERIQTSSIYPIPGVGRVSHGPTMPPRMPCGLSWQDPETHHIIGCAMSLAASVHGVQHRKVSGLSYLSHPVQAAGMVVQTGGSPRATVLALLHDVLEEGGPAVLNQLRPQFDDSICHAIISMTPAANESCLPWMEKKTLHLSRIQNHRDPDVLMSFAADKAATLYEWELNAAQLGLDAVLDRMGREKPWLWYYQEAAKALHHKVTPAMWQLLMHHIDWLDQRLQAAR